MFASVRRWLGQFSTQSWLVCLIIFLSTMFSCILLDLYRHQDQLEKLSQLQIKLLSGLNEGMDLQFAYSQEIATRIRLLEEKQKNPPPFLSSPVKAQNRSKSYLNPMTSFGNPPPK
jgi:hypothetical protein